MARLKLLWGTGPYAGCVQPMRFGQSSQTPIVLGAPSTPTFGTA